MGVVVQADHSLAGTSPKACVYCLGTNLLVPEQILERGEHLYLCAPRGQLVEGYLAIAPYRCVGSLSRIPSGAFTELSRLTGIVTSFYEDEYGSACGVMYEQGRGGGGASHDPDGGFPLHAHLCSLPLAVDLHGHFAARFESVRVAGPHDLAAASEGAPYLYVDCWGAPGQHRRRVYTSTSPAARRDLETSRVKPVIAGVVGLSHRADWRACDDDDELERVIGRFRRWRHARERS